MKLVSALALAAATIALVVIAHAEISAAVLALAGLVLIATHDYRRRPLAVRLATPLSASQPRRRKPAASSFRAPALELDTTRFTA